MQCPNLVTFQYTGNPIEYIPPQLQRWLNRLDWGEGGDEGAYVDQQSVHNAEVQKTFRDSVALLLGTPSALDLPGTLRSIRGARLTTYREIAAFSADQEVYCALGVTFGQLLIAVWDRIRNFDVATRKVLYARMDEEITEAVGMCFTGRITRLVNVLVGFVDGISIGISETDQLNNLALVALRQPTPRSWFLERVRELGYPSEVYQVYLEDLE
jgi:hypothetical protein